MDEQVKQALEQGGVIDITTSGRKTGQARRIEIRFHNIDGHLYEGSRHFYRPKTSCLIFHVERCALRARA
jgi:hypothetical protein